MVRKIDFNDYEPDIHERRACDETVKYCDCGRKLQKHYEFDYSRNIRYIVWECDLCQ